MEHPVFNKIENSSKPDFGDILSKSFDLYKKVFSQGLVHTLVTLAISIPFMLLVYIPLFPMYVDMLQNGGDPYYQPDFLQGMAPVMIVVWVLLVFALSFIMQIFNYSVQGHFLRQMKNIDMETNDEIGGFFTIAKEHFSKLFVLSLAITGIALVAALACYLPIFYVMVPMSMMLPIFVFNQDLSVGDIVKAGFKIGNKYWGVFFGIMLVAGIIGSLGIIACYIGILFTAFFGQIASYYMYKDTIGFDEPNSIES